MKRLNKQYAIILFIATFANLAIFQYVSRSLLGIPKDHEELEKQRVTLV